MSFCKTQLPKHCSHTLHARKHDLGGGCSKVTTSPRDRFLPLNMCHMTPTVTCPYLAGAFCLRLSSPSSVNPGRAAGPAPGAFRGTGGGRAIACRAIRTGAAFSSFSSASPFCGSSTRAILRARSICSSIAAACRSSSACNMVNGYQLCVQSPMART